MNERNVAPNSLDNLAGQRVRWKQRGRWRYGHVGPRVLEQDGSLRVYDDHNGAARALRLNQVERLIRGPRGGTRWAPWESVEKPAPPSSDHLAIRRSDRSPPSTRRVGPHAIER